MCVRVRSRVLRHWCGPREAWCLILSLASAGCSGSSGPASLPPATAQAAAAASSAIAVPATPAEASSAETVSPAPAVSPAAVPLGNVKRESPATPMPSAAHGGTSARGPIGAPARLTEKDAGASAGPTAAAPRARDSPGGTRAGRPVGIAPLLEAFDACARTDRRCTLVCVSRRGHLTTCTMTMLRNRSVRRAE